MKSVRKNSIVRGMAAAFVAAVMLASCNTEQKDQEIDALQSQLDQITTQYNDVKAANSQFDGRLASKDSTITAQAAEIQRLINQLRSNNPVKADKKHVAQLEKEVEELQNRLQNMNNQLDNKEVEVSTASSKADQKEKELQQAQNELQKKQEALNNAQDQAARLQSQLDEANSQKNQSTCKVRKNNKALKAENKMLRSENEALKAAASKTPAVDMRGFENEIKQLRSQLASKESDINSLNTQVKQLQSKCDKLSAQLADAQKAQNNTVANDNSAELQREIASLNSQLKQKEQELAAEKSALKSAQQEASAARSAQAKAEAAQREAEAKAAAKTTVNEKLNELQALCESYKAEIERLRAENEQLKNENIDLRGQVKKLSNASTQNDQANSRIAQKLALASILVTNNVVAVPGKEVLAGNMVKPATKASQTNVFRIDFDILSNYVVDPGTISLYARISNANNKLVSNGNNISFDMNGVTMQCTAKQDIEFTGSGRHVTMLWKRVNTELEAGLYWITLYANGNEIGKTSVVLK